EASEPAMRRLGAPSAVLLPRRQALERLVLGAALWTQARRRARLRLGARTSTRHRIGSAAAPLPRHAALPAAQRAIVGVPDRAHGVGQDPVSPALRA
ncbi:MAG: hypothetical protein H6Q03_2017, partial [Acidobacteria bacterium]|nr:hypothetical protein [Acidobacteriota bacterium]